MAKKFVTLFLMFATLMWLSPMTHARHSGSWGHESCELHQGLGGKFFFKAHFILDHADEIGLTEEQQNDIRNLKNELKKNLIKQEAEIEVVKVDVDHLVHQNPIDTEVVNRLIDQQYEFEKAKSIKEVDAIARLKQILSAEQYEKMKELLKGKQASKKRL